MEQELPAELVIVKMICDKCGDGEMKPDGNIALLSDPPKYPHRCDKCSSTDSYTQRYPTVRYKAK
jgi:hypothetical protein